MCYNCITTETVHDDILHFGKWASGLLITKQISELKDTAICYSCIYTSIKSAVEFEFNNGFRRLTNHWLLQEGLLISSCKLEYSQIQESVLPVPQNYFFWLTSLSASYLTWSDLWGGIQQTGTNYSDLRCMLWKKSGLTPTPLPHRLLNIILKEESWILCIRCFYRCHPEHWWSLG